MHKTHSQKKHLDAEARVYTPSRTTFVRTLSSISLEYKRRVAWVEPWVNAHPMYIHEDVCAGQRIGIFSQITLVSLRVSFFQKANEAQILRQTSKRCTNKFWIY